MTATSLKVRLKEYQQEEAVCWGVRFRRKRDVWWWRLIMLVSENHRDWFWVTWRWPWEKLTTIWVPDSVLFVDTISSSSQERIVEHEFYHVIQLWSDMVFGQWWWSIWQGLRVFGLWIPMLWSLRFDVEKWAFLYEIVEWGMSVDEAVEILWDRYWWPRPKSYMRQWFKKQLEV